MSGTNDYPPGKDPVGGEPTPADPRYFDQDEPISRDVDYRDDGVGRADYVAPRTADGGPVTPEFTDANSAPATDSPRSAYPLADRAGYPDRSRDHEEAAYTDVNRSDYVDPDRTAAFDGADVPRAAHPGTAADTTPTGTVTDTTPHGTATDVRPSGLLTDPSTGELVDREGAAAGAPVDPSIDERDKGGYRITSLGGFLLGIVRILAGWIFLWDFIDKTFGLGKATPSGSGWVDGTRPTEGFLQSVVAAESTNPFKPMFQFFLDQSWTDWAFMAGLLLVGVALILGLLTWLAAIGGAIIMVLIYLASWPLETNPFLDYHLFVAVTLLALAASNAGAYLGLGKPWRTTTAYRKRKVDSTTTA